jgi:endonuclease III related protein
MSAHLEAAFESLRPMHAWRGWVWGTQTSPFEIAVGAILVQNTAWTNVERALANLRAAHALDPATIGRLAQEELEALIRPSGQFRQKARKLREFVALSEAYGGFERLLALPPAGLREALLGTWGIGPETADCIVLYCARQPSFVVDAYTRRIFSRLGLGPAEDSYDSWQAFFESALPRDPERWAAYHALIVLHAKHLCLKRAPHCADCSLRPRCAFAAGDTS